MNADKIRVYSCLFVVSLCLCGIVWAGPTNELEQLRLRAEQAERGHAPDEAIPAYEEIAQKDPPSRSVVGRRLLDLYVETRHPQKAMEWARELMKTSPNPQAYLAGVYERMNMYTESRAILEREIAACEEPQRKSQLLLQLAALCEKIQDLDSAERALTQAGSILPAGPQKESARKLLAMYHSRHIRFAGDGNSL